MEMDLNLIFLFLLVVLASIYVPVLNQTIIRSALCLVLILFIPGYTLVAALYPRKDDLEGIERVLLSFGLSISIVPLTLLVLNYTPWGIRINPITVCLTIFSIVCIIAANLRRHKLPKEDRFSVGFKKAYDEAMAELFKDKSRMGKALVAILAIYLLLSIAMIAYVVAIPRQSETYTEFYILGANQSDDYPKTLHIGDVEPIVVGVVNHEYRNVTYDVVVRLNNSVISTQLYEEQILLADNQTVEKHINITPNRAGTNMKLEFLLYADGNMTAPYRECYLWVTVANTKSAIQKIN